MRIVIAGAHGKVALLLARLLASRGDEVVGLIRNRAHATDLVDAGARPVVLDLEQTEPDAIATVLAGADAAVFAAGAGPGSTAARKYTVDRDGAIRLAEAAQRAGVLRVLQISTLGTGTPAAPGGDGVWAAYIDAKTQAEDDLRARPLDWTVLRPGRLTDEPATGTVALVPAPGTPGAVPRADVAGVLVALLSAPTTARRTLDLVSGDVPIAEAVAAL